MITYVNTVFVSNLDASNIAGSIDAASAVAGKGKFIFVDADTNQPITSSNGGSVVRFKIGMGTGKGIKWSNVINVADIKGWADHTGFADTEDTTYIDLSGATTLIDPTNNLTLSTAGKRIIVRLTFKDLPTRYRKWTESYEYVTKDGDTAASIAAGIVDIINNKNEKRARVKAHVGSITTASSATSTEAVTTIVAESSSNAGDGEYFHEGSTGSVIQLVAMKYDDDESVDSINWYNKVRFNVNMYYTDPAADGWESLNKHFITGATIQKVPGKTSPSSAKLVRDREAQAMGYEGILNRGEGTWPIIKPAMNTELDKQYNSVTLEFENMYRTADDLFRKTKQSVEIYTTAATSTITTILGYITGAVDKTIDKD